MDWGLTELSAQ